MKTSRPCSPALLAAALVCLAGPARGQMVEMFPAAVPVTPSINADFTLQINIHNAGTRASTNLLVVTNVLPAGWTLVSASVDVFRQGVVDGFMWYVNDPPQNPVVTQNGRSLVFRPHPVPAGWWRPLRIVARAGTTGLYTNIVTVDPGAGSPDANPANNTLVHTVEVRPPSISVVGGQSTPEQSGGNSVFTVRLGSSNALPVSVEFQTLDGTARAGEDFQAMSGSLTFPPGVLERTVAVPVQDDALHEAARQEFSLRLTNAVNADIDAFEWSNGILDDEPPLVVSISDAAPVEEGDSGFTNAVFNLTLSGVADVPVLVDFSATPPLATNGTVAIPAGTTGGTFNILVPGNVSVETNRSFQVTLSNPRGAPGQFVSLGQAQAQGTVVDDDARPGKFHHMSINAVASPQLAGRPVPVAVTVRDYFDVPVTNYTDGVDVTGAVLVGHTYQHVVVLGVSNFVDGVALVGVTFTNTATNAIITAWRNGGGYYSATLTPSFRVVPKPTLFISAPGPATEGDGLLAALGRVSITNIDVLDVVVQLTAGDPQELALPPSVIIPAGQTSAVFSVTVLDDNRLDGSQSSPVIATSPGYVGASAAVTVHDNESANLSLTLASNHVENAWATLGTVSVSSPVAVATGITITSDDPSEISLPNNAWVAVVPAGQTSASFYFYVRDDTLLDGPQPVTLTAHVRNWVDGTATTIVLDNDTNLVVNLLGDNKQPLEGLGTRSNSLLVALPAVAVEDVTVQLASSDPTEILVPPFVVIPAGQQSAYANITFPDDDEFDGTQIVTITATRPGLNPGTRTLAVPDNDVHHIVFAPIPPAQTSGVPFRVSLTVKDVNDATMLSFPGGLTLSAFRGATALPMTPTVASNFQRGFWTGNVTINGWGTNLHLTATATNGLTAQSNPFTIPAPAWVADVRIHRWEWRGAEAEFFFNTVTGQVYQVETAANLIGVPWLPATPAVLGNGGEMALVHSNIAATVRGFYRLVVTP